MGGGRAATRRRGEERGGMGTREGRRASGRCAGSEFHRRSSKIRARPVAVLPQLGPCARKLSCAMTPLSLPQTPIVSHACERETFAASNAATLHTNCEYGAPECVGENALPNSSGSMATNVVELHEAVDKERLLVVEGLHLLLVDDVAGRAAAHQVHGLHPHKQAKELRVNCSMESSRESALGAMYNASSYLTKVVSRVLGEDAAAKVSGDNVQIDQAPPRTPKNGR